MSKHIRQLRLSPAEEHALQRQIRQTADRKLADRLRVILYKAKRYGHKHIASLLQIGINQVTKVLRNYQLGGVAEVLATHYQGSQPHLSPEQQHLLIIELQTHIYHTAAQVVAWVTQQWDIRYTQRGMQKLLKRLDFSYKKNRLIPSKADPEKQRQFVQWFQQLRATLGPADRIYFGDAVHLKHNAEAGYAWSLVGAPHQIPTNSGRERYNILGAYCTQTHEHVFILTEANINQETLIALLQQLRTYHGEHGNLYLVLDNASYNRARRVQAQALVSTITLKFQPPYSPNLNLIERLWKFMRKMFCQDKYRGTFTEFRQQLDAFFAHLDQHRSALATLLVENFELIPACWAAPSAA